MEECLEYTKQDMKNYLRSKRQNQLAYEEAGSLLKYFQNQVLENLSFFYAIQLDSAEQISADARMIVDYTQFGDLLSFDTTCIKNKANIPLALFIGLNHHVCVL